MTSKAYFDRVALRWDGMRAAFFSDAVREKAIAAACVRRGRLAADVGAGTGFMTDGLLREGLRVIAIDESREMLAVMRQKFAAQAGVEYYAGSAEALPIADSAVDYVFANMCLHHVPHPQLAVREMARIMKSKGVLVITDLDAHAFEFLREEHHDRWMGFDRDQIRGWLLDAGLNTVALRDAEETCCAASECGTQSASVSIFVASGIK
jgi:ubiquinone/menaquinone biosynthesis C-methylase UbiE